MRYKGLLFLLAPLAALALLAVTLLSRSETRVVKKAAAPKAVVAASPSPAPSPAPPKRLEIPKPGTPQQLARASEESRIRTTYQNFRTAVATGNTALQEALRPVLARDLDAALRFGEEDLARSKDSADRAITERALAALRR